MPRGPYSGLPPRFRVKGNAQAPAGIPPAPGGRILSENPNGSRSPYCPIWSTAGVTTRRIRASRDSIAAAVTKTVVAIRMELAGGDTLLQLLDHELNFVLLFHLFHT